VASKLTPAQILLGRHLEELGLEPEFEVRFSRERKFRFDIGLWDQHIGIEVCGGHWNGGHRHRKAIELDYEKSRIAQMEGWRCLYFTNEEVANGTAKRFFQKYFPS
jgi:very-short-patch-repair endonuclease